MILTLLGLSVALNFLLALSFLLAIYVAFFLYKKFQNSIEVRFVENEKSIQYLAKSIQTLDITNLFVSSLYGQSSNSHLNNTNKSSSTKKPTSPLSIVKDKNNSTIQQNTPENKEP